MLPLQRYRRLRHYGVEKLERGSGEIGVPVVGKVRLRKETLVMVYVCEITNLPFLATLVKVSCA